MRMIQTVGVIAAASLCAAVAYGDSVLQFDVNSLTASDSGGVFGTSYTGTITLAEDGNSTLQAILINGSDQGIASGQLTSFDGEITLVGGVVTGGWFTIVANGVETYDATIINGSGSVGTAAGQSGPFTIDGLTFMGTFSGLTGNLFAGVDVSDWILPNGASGSFLEFKYAGGIDDDADIDIFVVVPMPAPAGLAAAGLIGLATVRRRR